MTTEIPWSHLERAFPHVERTEDHAGRLKVTLGTRSQTVHVRRERGDGSPDVLRITSPVATAARAMQALVLGFEVPHADHDAFGTDVEPQANLPHKSGVGRGFLQLFQHNDRLRGVQIQMEDGELVVTTDLVCLTDAIDVRLLTERIHHLARVADGMEQRISGAGVAFDRY